MKRVLKYLCLLLIFPLVGCLGLTGCSFDVQDWDINDGFDKEDYIPPEYDFDISATLDEITVKVSDIGYEGEVANLVALPSYQYLFGEEVKGLSEATSATPIVLGEYECGTSQTITFDRYINGDCDGVYYKYFILSDADEILAGPMFCTEIEPLYKHDELITPVNKKGVTSEDSYNPYISDLKCSYTALNFVVDNMFVPNEIYENGKIIPLEYEETTENGKTYICSKGSTPAEVEYVDFLGKRYYFRPEEFARYDSIIKAYSDDNVKVTLIVLLRYIDNQYAQPYFLKYPGTNNAKSYIQPNTSNEYGAGYWGALMEFLGRRYSQENSPYGNIESYVLGNEIDLSTSWNSIVAPGQAALSLEDYVEEYEREMRISNQALKKYYQGNQVLVSITHFWSARGEEYAPKEILDYMTIKTNKQGNYDYGFAVHPYGVTLNVADFWRSDLASPGFNGSLNTSYITWSNLEVLQLYLEQSSKLCNGKIRNVFLTEGGVSSSRDGNMSGITKMQQAAGVAYLYYKSVQLSCIKAIIYYRLMDHDGDGAYFGLINLAGQTKPAYEVWKYIDTQYSYDISRPYLKQIQWVTRENGKVIYHGVNFDVNEYRDTMKLINSRFDWDTRWNEDLVQTRWTDDILTL